jgi:hypothetical protein
MDRWALRVAAYAGLMVDQYPPFRLDMGGDDPGTTRLDAPQDEPHPGLLSPPPPPPRREPERRMSAGRTIALIVGVLVTLASLLGLTVGGAMAWLDQARRDSAGFVTSDKVTLSTTGYALASEQLTIDAGAASVPHRWFGDARVRVETVSGGPVFVGLASVTDVRRYLAGVAYTTVRAVGPNTTTYADHAGTAPAAAPTDLKIWRVQAAGPGEQTITWPIENGDWTLVVMATDGSKDLSVRADVGATAPALQWLWIGILTSSGVFLLLGTLTVVLAVIRQPKQGPSTLQTTPGSRVE